jgi:hypothetical protein
VQPQRLDGGLHVGDHARPQAVAVEQRQVSLQVVCGLR